MKLKVIFRPDMRPAICEMTGEVILLGSGSADVSRVLVVLDVGDHRVIQFLVSRQKHDPGIDTFGFSHIVLYSFSSVGKSMIPALIPWIFLRVVLNIRDSGIDTLGFARIVVFVMPELIPAFGIIMLP